MWLLSLLVDIFMICGLALLGAAAFIIHTVVGLVYTGGVCIAIAILLKNMIEEARK